MKTAKANYLLKSFSFLAGLLVMALVQPLEAQGIAISNYSFESPNTSDFSDTINDWTMGPGDPAGVQSVTSAMFSAGAPDGKQAGLIKYYGGYISQNLNSTLQSGYTYTLTWYAGIRNDEPSGYVLASSTVSLYRTDTGTVLTKLTFSNENIASRGVFQQFSISFVPSAADVGASIGISVEKDSGGTQLVFDDFSLTATSTGTLTIPHSNSVAPPVLAQAAPPVVAQVRNDNAAAATGCAACGGFIGFLILTIVAIIALNIALLVWVARDAKSRGMDSSVLWMFLVMFIGLLGLVIYLFARPQGNLIPCPSCNNKRLQVSAKCPHCGNA